MWSFGPFAESVFFPALVSDYRSEPCWSPSGGMASFLPSDRVDTSLSGALCSHSSSLRTQEAAFQGRAAPSASLHLEGPGVAFPAQVTRKKYGLMKEEAFFEPPVMCRRVFTSRPLPTVWTCCDVGEVHPESVGPPEWPSGFSGAPGWSPRRLRSNRLFVCWASARRSPASDTVSHALHQRTGVNLRLQSRRQTSGFDPPQRRISSPRQLPLRADF